MSWLKDRQTHSVHHTKEEAQDALYDLGKLMNGTPFGYVFCVMPKMGKFAFISLPDHYFKKRG